MADNTGALAAGLALAFSLVGHVHAYPKAPTRSHVAQSGVRVATP
jgi:hypothetical protein